MHGRFSIIGGTCPGCPQSTPISYQHSINFLDKKYQQHYYLPLIHWMDVWGFTLWLDVVRLVLLHISIHSIIYSTPLKVHC